MNVHTGLLIFITALGIKDHNLFIFLYNQYIIVLNKKHFAIYTKKYHKQHQKSNAPKFILVKGIRKLLRVKW